MQTAGRYERLLLASGGCGYYQVYIVAWYFANVVIFASQLSFMIFGGYTAAATAAFAGFNATDSRNASNFSANLQSKEFFSIIAEWDLSGPRSHYWAMITSLQMAGVLVGPMICGQLSDRFGRLPTYRIFFVCLLLSEVLSDCSVNWQMFAAARGLIGVFLGACSVVCFVLVSEVLGSKWRLIINLCWPMASLWLVVLAKLTQHWRWMGVGISLSGLPALILLLGIYESPKWLMQSGKHSLAQDVFRRVAKRNRCAIADNELFVGLSEPSVTLEKAAQTPKCKLSYWHLFASRALAVNTAMMMLCGMVTGCVYYGVLFNIRNLSGDIALNFLYIMLCRVVTSFLIIVLDVKVPNFGRRMLHQIGLLGCLCSLCALAVLYGVGLAADHPHFVVILAISTICFGGTIFAALTGYSAELFPTEMRNMGLSSSTAAGRIGPILSPQILLLFPVWKPAPFMVFACLMLFNAVLAFLLLPETKNSPLPDLDNIPKKDFKGIL